MSEMARLGLTSVAAKTSGCLLRLQRKATNSSSAASKVLTRLEYRPLRTCRVGRPGSTAVSIVSCHLIDPTLLPSTTTSNVPRMIPAGLVNASCVTFRVGDTLILLSGAVGIGPRCRKTISAAVVTASSNPLLVRSRTPGGTHRPAYHRRLPPPGRPGTPAARQRQPGLPPPGRPAPPPARRARQVGVRQAGLALLDARRPRRPPALRPGMGADSPGRHAPHRAVPARGGRRRGALDRHPARPEPRPPGGDAGPPGPHPPPRRERTLPGPRRVHRRRAAVRAAVHRPGRPHRGPPPHPRRDRQG